MKTKLLRILVSAVLLTACAAGTALGQSVESKLDRIELPKGFTIALFHNDVPGARSLALGEPGTVFVGSRGEGRVYALKDVNGDGLAEEKYVIDEGLNSPNGVAYRDGSLFVAEIDRVIRYDNIEARLVNPPEPVVVNDSFPEDGHHGWKYIAFGPDGLLYVPVGAPCNVCLPPDNRFSTIMRMRPDGSGLEIFAEGIRNTVGFDWNPATGFLWFTDNGRDWMGDNRPPDELNRAPVKGLHFGFPYIHGKDISDPQYGDKLPPEITAVAPEQELGPHVAALGMKFYEGTLFPQEYRGDIFIAEHGSWNRSVPIGYRITRVRVEQNRAVGYEVFARGWLNNGRDWGRPVDVLELPDGSLLVSDDAAGAVYRISYSP